MIDLLIIRHEEDTPPGSTLLWAQQNNLKYHVWNIASEPTPFLPEEIKSLIVCGGSMDTFEEDKFPWLRAEKDFIKKCIDRGMPVFGLCLGSQLLAEVLGGSNSALGKWEIGFVPVSVLENGTATTLQVFHWHQCGFELPPGAQLIASNDFHKNQAFSWGNNVIATQFHPEAMEDWITACAQWVTEEPYSGLVQNKEEMLSSISLQKPLQEWFFQQLDKWFKIT